MAPGTVTRTYSICNDKKKKKKRRPWANIHKVLSEIQNEENTESVTVFDALFKENIKSYRPKRCKKNAKYKEKERSVDGFDIKLKKEGRKIDIVNLSPAMQDSCLETTFDRILAGPLLQHPNPPISSPGSTEFNSSSNSENHPSELSSNCTLFPIKCNHHEQTNEVGQDVDYGTASIVKKSKSLLRQSFRRLSHVVLPDDTRKSSLKSPSFRDVYCRELNATLSEEDENLVNEIAEPISYVPDVFTARDAVLQRCQQSAPIPFSEAFPSGYWLTCKKIGEGVYGEVFMSEAEDGSVLKIIPVEGEALVNGEPQKKFDEILSEVVIASELSNLRTGVTHRTASFSEMKRCICVQGKYPEEVINLWDDYDTQKGSENDSPEMFLEDQLYIILVLANGGCDLESYLFTNSRQTHSVFMQTAFALAVAEFSLQFEHRDLHWGNVLVSQTSKKHVVFRLCDQEYSIPTRGVQVTVIDFTLSRMSYDGCCIYNDLSKDPTLFTAKGDYQFEVYRLMQKCIQNSWHRFEPFTNILWLHYLVDKMCSLVKYRHKVARTHTHGLTTLKELRNDILNYASASEFILSENG